MTTVICWWYKSFVLYWAVKPLKNPKLYMLFSVSLLGLCTQLQFHSNKWFIDIFCCIRIFCCLGIFMRSLLYVLCDSLIGNTFGKVKATRTTAWNASSLNIFRKLPLWVHFLLFQMPATLKSIVCSWYWHSLKNIVSNDERNRPLAHLLASYCLLQQTAFYNNLKIFNKGLTDKIARRKKKKPKINNKT